MRFARRGPAALLPCVVALGLLLSSCETGFDPFEKGEIYYSVYGYLDTDADTQFVRVSPLRESIAVDPAPIDAVVTLENVRTGERSPAWRDSLFVFGNGRMVHNFWSTTEVLPGETYRFVVERSDGRRSAATVTTPAEAPPPILSTGVYFGVQPPLSHGIELPGVAKVADLRILYQTPDGPQFVSYTNRLRRTTTGWIVGFNAVEDLRDKSNFFDCPDVSGVEVFIATAAEDWPDLSGIDPETQALLGTTTNVEKGTGFLGGVYVSRFTWDALVGAIKFDRTRCS